jgi:hypothetical protein
MKHATSCILAGMLWLLAVEGGGARSVPENVGKPGSSVQSQTQAPPLVPHECRLVPVPSSEALVAWDFDTASGPTNLQFGQKSDAKVILVEVQPGPQPVTLMITVKSDIIFEFRGAVDRVRNVIALPAGSDQQIGIGVIGIPAERVLFPDQKRCDRQSAQTALGRPADRVLVEANGRALLLPSSHHLIFDFDQHWTIVSVLPRLPCAGVGPASYEHGLDGGYRP